MEPTEEERERLERARKGDFDYRKVHVKDLPKELTELFKGEIYYQPKFVIMGGMSDDDPPYIAPALMDSSRRLDVVSSPYGIGSGNIRSVSGTYTKGATGTIGTLKVQPGTDDVLYFMYGIVLTGAVHAGAASPLTAGISLSPAPADIIRSYFYDATADVDEYFNLPGLGEVPAAGATPGTKTAPASYPIQNAIPSYSLVTEDGGAALGTSPLFLIEYQTMAAAEDFFVTLYFYSMNSTACTVTTGTSDSIA